GEAGPQGARRRRQLHAGHARHGIVGDQHGDFGALLQDAQRLGGGIGLERDMAHLGEKVDRVEGDQGIVIHHQNGDAQPRGRVELHEISFRLHSRSSRAETPPPVQFSATRIRKWPSWVHWEKPLPDDPARAPAKLGAIAAPEAIKSRPTARGNRFMHLLLVDGSGYIFRAFHALPPLSRKSDGLPVGCVQGFCNMLFKLTQDLEGDEAPTHMAVIFDAKGKTFRDDIYDQYKAQRPPPPEELVPQFPLTRAATRAFSIPAIEMEGWEADDIMATYACLARDRGFKVTIASSDKDLMQMVEPDGSIRLLDTIPRPGQPPLRWIGAEEVLARFGVTPDKVIDVQALCGDSVDNVPGVPGIGVKTAAELINTYGDLETLLARAEEIRQPARRQRLIEHAELARISKRLVTLERQVPVTLDLDALAREPISPASLFPFLKAMEFNTITRRLATLLEADPDLFEADPVLRAGGDTPLAGVPQKSTSLSVAKAKLAANVVPGTGPARHAAEEHARVKAIPVDHGAYEIVTTPDRLAAC